MTAPEPIRLKDLDGALLSAQRGELEAYRNAGPDADLKREMWESLARVRAAELRSSEPRSARATPRGWAIGALAAALLAGILLLRPKSAPELPRVRPPVASPRVEVTTPVAPAAAAEDTPSAAAPTSLPAGKLTRSRADGRPPRADALEELKLLTRARRLLPSRPETSLDLSREHAQLYPRGALAEEREVLAIEALLKLGRASQARQRARAFVRHFPDSSQRERLDALLVREP